MNTSSMNASVNRNPEIRDIPTTPRGRALYTIDWFLNGRPVLRNHDHPCMTLRRGFNC